MRDQAYKTEQPTVRRVERARREGQFPSAREFVTAIQFLAFVALLTTFGDRWFLGWRQTTRLLLSRAFGPELRSEDVVRICWDVFRRSLVPLVAAGVALAFLTLGIRLVTSRFGLSLKRLAPDPARLSPLARLRELPRQNLPALVQSLCLLPLFAGAVYLIARDNLESYLALPLVGVEAGTRRVAASLTELLWRAAVVFVVFGVIDLVRQQRRYRNDLKMSKQEIREELKEMEANQQVKMRIRRLQRDALRRQMMKEIPKATAVIVNPTHYAVALRYQLEGMAAPKVVAKGKNYLAQRIRQRAVEHEVPVIENAPLAQALYQSVEVGQEIPATLYRAVAEVLAYIYRLMHGRLPG